MRKVLIIDNDRKFLADLDGLALISHSPDIEIICAASIGEAKDIIRTEHPDEAVVSADILMRHPGWKADIPMRCYAKGQRGKEYADTAGIPYIGMGRKADEVLRYIQDPPEIAAYAAPGDNPGSMLTVTDPRMIIAKRHQLPHEKTRDYGNDPRNRAAQEASTSPAINNTGSTPENTYGMPDTQDICRQGTGKQSVPCRWEDYNPRSRHMLAETRFSRNNGTGEFVSFGLPHEEEEIMKVISQEVRFYTGPFGRNMNIMQEAGGMSVPSTTIVAGTDPRTVARNRQLTGYIPSEEINRYIENHGPSQESAPYQAPYSEQRMEGQGNVYISGDQQPGDGTAMNMQEEGKAGKKKKKKLIPLKKRKQEKQLPSTESGISPEAEAPGENNKKDTALGIGVIVAAFAIVGVILIIGSRFLYINSTVESSSMEPTVPTGSRIFGSRIAYNNNDVERGDVILFDSEVDYGNVYLKRVIGLPGETVEIREGEIYIDGSSTPLEEDYLEDDWTVNNDGYTFTVPDGSYLVLGDNRNDSFDSRMWAEYALNNGWVTSEEEAEAYAYVDEDDIVAKAMFIYLPFSDIGFIE